MRDRRGFALVLTLVVTAILVAVVTEFIREVYVDTTLRRTYLNSQQASLLADSGVEVGKAALQVSRLLRNGDYTSLHDEWAKPRIIPADEGEVVVTIEEENGKLDLNSIPQTIGFHPYFGGIATRLLENLGIQPARNQPGGPLLDAIADWADAGDEPRFEGAESSYYLGLKVPYKCRNMRFNSPDELNLVRGFTPDVMYKLRPYITAAYDTPSPMLINVNTAPEAVLAALPGMTPQLAQDVVKYRQNHEFKSLSDLQNAGVPAAVTTGLAGAARVSGSVYRITSKAKIGEAVRTIETVVNMATATTVKTLYWREY